MALNQPIALISRRRLEEPEFDKMLFAHRAESREAIIRDAAISAYALGFTVYFLRYGYTSLKMHPATVIRPGLDIRGQRAPNSLDDNLSCVRRCLTIVALAWKLPTHIAVGFVSQLEGFSHSCIGHEAYVSTEQVVSSDHFVHTQCELERELMRVFQLQAVGASWAYCLGMAMAKVVDVLETGDYNSNEDLTKALNQYCPQNWPVTAEVKELNVIFRDQANARLPLDQVHPRVNSLRLNILANLREFSISGADCLEVGGTDQIPHNDLGIWYDDGKEKLCRQDKSVAFKKRVLGWGLLCEILSRRQKDLPAIMPTEAKVKYRCSYRIVSGLRGVLAKLDLELGTGRYDLRTIGQRDIASK